MTGISGERCLSLDIEIIHNSNMILEHCMLSRLSGFEILHVNMSTTCTFYNHRSPFTQTLSGVTLVQRAIMKNRSTWNSDICRI